LTTSWEASDEISTFIPLSEYAGSSDERSEEEMNIQHIISPLLKTDKKPKGWKPKKLKYQLPGENEVEARNRMTKYQYQENVITSFKIFTK